MSNRGSAHAQREARINQLIAEIKGLQDERDKIQGELDARRTSLDRALVQRATDSLEAGNSTAPGRDA